MEPLQKIAGLECAKVDVNPSDVQSKTFDVFDCFFRHNSFRLDVIEAEKCMSNLIFLSPAVQKFYSVSGVADAITQRIKETTATKLDDGIRFFDMRMLFLLTALNPDIRFVSNSFFNRFEFVFSIV